MTWEQHISMGVKVYRCVLILAIVSISTPTLTQDSVENLVRAGHWKRARAALQRVQSDDARTFYLRGRVEYAFTNYSAALPLTEQAVRMDKANADAHLLLGQVNGQIATTAHLLRQISLVKIVKREFDVAYSLAPDNVDVLTALVEFHLRAPGIVGGDKKKAEQFAEALLKVSPPRGYLARALIARHNKDIAAAGKEYVKAAASGDDYVALVTAGDFFVLRNDDVAQQYANRAIALEPARAPAYAVLARVLAHQAKWPELDSLLSDSAHLVPDDLTPFFRVAEALLREGRQLDRAEAYLRHYLEQEPEAGSPSAAAANTLLAQVLAKEKQVSASGASP